MKSKNYTLLSLLCSIIFMLISTNLITLKIYDVLGNEVATLVNEEKPAGKYEIKFDGTGLPSGVYFYHMSIGMHSEQSGTFSETKKLILLK